MSDAPQFPGCRVLIVEDVLPLAIQYRAMARVLGVDTVAAASVSEARRQIDQGPWHAALVDINLPDGSGFDVVASMARRWPHCAVIVVSGEDSLDNAVRAAHAGAMDFIEKPVEADRLQITLRNALKTVKLAQRVEQLEPVQRREFHGFVGSSAPMRAVYSMLETVAQSRAPVFIQGESGTGKELAADAIHRTSSRARQPFVALNCASIPKELIESELFGHVKGAFTGATGDRAGAFIEADGGTLFLDEIGELDINVQAKLLRALQTGEVRRLGETRHQTVDVRIVSATHRDLPEMVREGRFREDLFYRLYVIPVELPPLRERGDDVLEIAQVMLERYSKEDHKPFRQFSPQAAAALRGHRWPGNVRELINVVRAAVALNHGTTMEADMLPLRAGHDARPPLTHDTGFAGTRRPAAVSPQETPGPTTDDIRPLALVEREAIEHALRLCGGNITRAARALQINPSTIHRKMSTWA